jgi:Fur family ferric uptake transcriptional regulator
VTAKRSTWQKAAIRDQLNEFNGFLSAQELYQRLLTLNQKVGLTTIYRVLAELEATAEADSLTLEDGETKYRACGSHHHHHLVCQKCGRAAEFDLPGFENAALEIAKRHGFTGVQHSIELFGICAECGVAN